ncbi:MAG: cob(I)yrinic acid a,c-diamide adenosyltransferase [Gammaproteobacteria bacterium]
MGHRLSKIYTRTGDDGSTGLGDGNRVSKDSPRVEAYGDVDELNSTIGLLLCHELPANIRRSLTRIQHELFDLGGELSVPGMTLVGEELVECLEHELDEVNAGLPMLKEFILPGGNMAAAHCHLARTVCRRAERRVVTLGRDEAINPAAAKYLNRLSDLLFVMARAINRANGNDEVLWAKGEAR